MSSSKRSHPPGTKSTEKKRSCKEQQEEESSGPKTEDSFPSVVELNVGGKVITTLLSTLRKEPASDLAAMFTEKNQIEKDKDGRYFLDCDAEGLLYILNFLRLGTLPPTEKALSVYDLAKRLKIGKLASKLENYQTVKYRERIENIRSMYMYERTRKDIIEKIISTDPTRSEKSLLLVNNFCSYCKCVDSDIVLKKNKDLYTKVYVKYNLYDANDFEAILCYDLCEMGYAKCIKLNTISGKCRFGDHELTGCKLVLLSQ